MSRNDNKSSIFAPNWFYFILSLAQMNEEIFADWSDNINSASFFDDYCSTIACYYYDHYQ